MGNGDIYAMSEHYLEPTDRPILYAVTGTLGGSAVAEHGTTRVGDATTIGQTLAVVSGEDENEFIGGVPVDVWPPLPDSGWLGAGDIYQWSEQAVMVRQSHNRTIYDPPDTPALFLVYRPDAGDVLDWVAGEQVYVGTRRMYDGTEYEAIQAHVTQSDWTPPQVLGVLWSVVVSTPEWQAGVAYTGDNTAGAGNGDVVTYNGSEYRCWQSHTSQIGWEPPNVPALWIAL